MHAGSHEATRLDPEAIEARTQSIGRELIATAKRAHEHFSVLNRWTEQVLSWCMGDASLKGTVLRFIDVLPSLESSRAVARHVREYFPRSDRRLPAALRLGSSLTRGGLLTAPAVAAIVRELVERVAGQFIAESRTEGIRRVVGELAAVGAACSVDVLGEQVLSEAESEAYAAEYSAILDEIAAAYASLPASDGLPRCGPLVNVSVKPTALTPRFDPICPAESVDRAQARLDGILAHAAESGAVVNLDMEEYAVRDLTIELAKRLLGQSWPPSLGIVIQAYLRDSEAVLEDVLGWLAAHDRRVAVRLVRGAYWDHEVALARRNHWPVPVYEDKAATDAAFERLTERLLGAFPRVSTAIASHNLRSIAHAMAVAEALDLPRDGFEFQLLYGMGEAIREAIAARGHPVRVYTPVGQLVPGMGYLVRRLLENSSNESFLRRDFLAAGGPEEMLRAPRQSPVGSAGVGASSPTRPWAGEPPSDFSRAGDREAIGRGLERVRERLGARHPLRLGEEVVETTAWLTARSPAALDQILGEVALASPADAERAVEIALAAGRGWARTAVGERVACLRRAAALMRAERGTLAAWEILEVGKTWREADADVVEAIDYLEYYGDQMEGLAGGRPLLQAPGERNTYAYAPRGVAAVIAPWNFPLAIAAGMTSAALVSGNPVIFKPAEQSSLIGMELVRLLHAAGVPPGVLQCLPGAGETAGAALVRHPQVALILFTGSKDVGLEIVAAAGRVVPGQRSVKHVVAEMGGKNALIVDADADLDAAIAGTLTSAFGYAGQKCSAASRLIVLEAVADRFLARLAAATDRLVIGDPADPCTDMGPLIDAAAEARLSAAIAEAAAAGTVVYRYPEARLPRRGFFVGPLIVAGLAPEHRLSREELFGPLLCVFRVGTFAEALALANDTDYALTGGVYSRSPANIAAAREEFDVGNLYVNRPITGALVGRQPFGGHRLSGLGTKAGGPDYLLQLMVPRTVSEDTRRHGTPLGD
jgi:RHH-type proline utilization regulon transcriptional repressor/proline dehydrogenase/delta 1-pyrroline-5-carboxylate dehydrogenase